MNNTPERLCKKVFFADARGCYYPFTLYPIGTKLPNKPAVYVYMHVECGDYTPLYIGETGALDTPFLDQRVWRCVNIHFVNAIGVYLEKDKEKRCNIEQDLIRIHQPICNATSR